jgi:ABC-type glutathione transport system ATPase component
MTKEEIKKKYDEIVDFAELHEFMDTPVKWYSSGMIARLGFSIAAHIQPKILLVDEVLSVGDFTFQKKCFDKMRSFKNDDVTIIFVSHNLKAISSLCDKVLLLTKGEKVFLGKPDEAITTYLKTTGAAICEEKTHEVFIEQGTILNKVGIESHTFISGEKVTVDLSLRFTKAFNNTCIVLKIFPKNQNFSVFSTDCVRLGKPHLFVKKGQLVHVVINLTLNLAPGEYELWSSVLVGEMRERIFSQVFSHLVIQEDKKFTGIANLKPELIELSVI